MIVVGERLDDLEAVGSDGEPGDGVAAVAVDLLLPPAGADGLVWRLPDGRLVGVWVSDAPEGAEDEVRQQAQGRLALSQVPFRVGDLDTLGIRAGLEAGWLSGDEQ